MRLEVDPPVSDDQLAVLHRALASSGLRLDGTPPAFSSAWLKSAFREGVESAFSPARRYALSPRSTRGATRA
jgi:hypothetical protein